MFQAYYTDEFVLPLPPGHRFPMQKYRLLRDKVRSRLPDISLQVPAAASDGQLALAHCPSYIERVRGGGLCASEQKAIGFPWSEQMVERSLRSVGATVDAVRSAFQYGASVNLAGGTHHAGRAGGSGFCVFNDQAVAARVAQTDALAAGQRVPKVLVIDLDVHQGDGTAEILQGDDSVFTFSMHGADNFPFIKKVSDLDVALPTHCGDDEYLSQLEQALSHIQNRFSPSIVLYLAGLDVHQADRLGKLGLSDLGIAERDSMVLAFAARHKLPVAASMGGGYFPDLEHLTDLQTGVIQRLAAYATSWQVSPE